MFANIYRRIFVAFWAHRVDSEFDILIVFAYEHKCLLNFVLAKVHVCSYRLTEASFTSFQKLQTFASAIRSLFYRHEHKTNINFVNRIIENF